MRPNIDFGECLKDSPRFRASLEEAENDIDLLEAKLEKLVKLCSSMIETGKTFNNAQGAFTKGVHDIAGYFKEDDLVSTALKRFSDGMAEIQRYQSILLDQAHRSICKNLNNFVKNDIKKVKETRKHFEKISDDMDNALIKNMQAPRSKPQDCEDANNVLTAMRSCFAHTSLDYVFQINILHSKKRFDVLDTMLAYMHAQNAYFHQGNDLFADVEPYMKQVAAQLEEVNAKAAAERKEMEERHSLVQQREVSLSQALASADETDNNAGNLKMEGYLFKRTSNAFKTWVRRWFMIKDNQLVYRKRSKDNLTVMEEDLRLCTVKPAIEIDRRFCFEVVSPARSHMLQADSDSECQAWINAIQAGVTNAYRESSQETEKESCEQTMAASASADSIKSPEKAALPKPPSRTEQILSIPGNKYCCDCGSEEPRWASINFGITLCIECSGIHRSFGVHMSKVRSITLDAWEPELLKVMGELGNNVANRIFEANVDENIQARATPQCNRTMREAWIRAKYIQKAFIKKLPDSEEPKAEESVEPSLRKWTVSRRKRRSPAKSILPKKGEVFDEDGKDSPGAEGGSSLMVQGASQDSGLGSSTPDVIVFGAGINDEEEATLRSMDLDDSEESTSEPEADQDTRSTTSFEEFTKLHPNMLLYKAAQARNLPVMLEALAQGADPNWHNDDELGTTALIKAVESGSMAACEFLLLNGAKVDRKDNRGRTALHHSTIMGHTGQVCLFLKRRANQHAVDVDGLDALSIAINNANADIVTLLRLAKLNEEMRETEGLHGTGDETFAEVFRDFTQMANNNPEKLNRNK